jgi:hypothetical protein
MILFFSDILLAKTFIREHYYRAGKNDTEITSRAIALHQVKARLLEEIGTYMESTFESTEQEGGGLGGQFTKYQIVSITAGITETKILEERWDGKIYYIKAEIDVDIDDTRRKIREISQDRERMREIEAINRKADEALRQIEMLTKSKKSIPIEYTGSHIMKVDGRKVVIGLGLLNGVRKSQQFKIIKSDSKVNPRTGVIVHKETAVIGALKVINTDEWTSDCVVISGAGRIKPGDLISPRAEKGIMEIEGALSRAEPLDEFKFRFNWKFPYLFRMDLGYLRPYFMESFGEAAYLNFSFDWPWFEIGPGFAGFFRYGVPLFGGASIVMRVGPYEGPINIILRHNGGKFIGADPNQRINGLIETNWRISGRVLLYGRMHQYKGSWQAGEFYHDDKGYQYNTRTYGGAEIGSGDLSFFVQYGDVFEYCALGKDPRVERRGEYGGAGIKLNMTPLRYTFSAEGIRALGDDRSLILRLGIGYEF